MAGEREVAWVETDEDAEAIVGLRAEVARLTAAIARHLERAARDDHEAMSLGREDAMLDWADLPEAYREEYRDAVAADFWRES